MNGPTDEQQEFIEKLAIKQGMPVDELLQRILYQALDRELAESRKVVPINPEK